MKPCLTFNGLHYVCRCFPFSPQVYGRDLDQVYGRDLDQVYGRDLDQVYGRDLDQVYGRDLDQVYGRDLDQVYGRDLDQIYERHLYQTSVSRSGPYRPPGGVEEMQGGGRRVRLEWGAYITV
ncbi:hypothetical protein FHG87_018878 [Trinorchestia longiramus]|nr:hypothetical protein FHG87_018878 [Trinorchestia longiramus]